MHNKQRSILRKIPVRLHPHKSITRSIRLDEIYTNINHLDWRDGPKQDFGLYLYLVLQNGLSMDRWLAMIEGAMTDTVESPTES